MFRKIWAVLVVAVMFTSVGVKHQQATAAEKNDEDVVFTVAFSVDNLPVWTVDSQGQPQFDPSLLVSHIKSNVAPETWGRKKAEIKGYAKEKLIFVSQTKAVIDQLHPFLSRLRAFAEHDPTKKLCENCLRGAESYRRVLILVADPHSPSTDNFFRERYGESTNPLLIPAFKNYIVQCATPEQARKFEFWRDAQLNDRSALVAVVNSDGEKLAEADFERFHENDHLDASAFAEFLNEHAVQLPNAETELQTALLKAGQEGKHVLLEMGGPNCGSCVILSNFLDRQKSLVSKDYVHLKLDTRMANADAINEELVGGVPTIPWMAIVSSDRKVLATSVGPDGNIGYPSKDTSKAHFREMLESTSKRLTPDDMDALLKAIDEK